MHGTGEYTFSTGTKYVGEWRDGMFHGKGVMHFPNGTQYEATWENGKVVEVRRNSVMLLNGSSHVNRQYTLVKVTQ